MRSTATTPCRVRAATASLLITLATVPGTAIAQAPADSVDPRQLALLIDVALARAAGATLADRDAAATTTGTTPTRHSESMRLKLSGQWGLAAEVRVPVGESRRWGVELYGSRFRGRARGTFATRDSVLSAAGGTTNDLREYRLSGVTSWRATLALARAVPVGRYRGAVFLGGTYGRVRNSGVKCTSGSTNCQPGASLALNTPGVTTGFDIMSRPWRRLRVRVGGKADVLSIDEREVRDALKPPTLTTAVAGEGGRVWRVLPSAMLGLVIQFRSDSTPSRPAR
jgi:hypothetical protein